MKRNLLYIITLTVSIIVYSCNLQIISSKISVQVKKGAGNNYYEIEIITNKNLNVDNTNSFTFSLSDSNNTLLEVTSGYLESGIINWTSVKTYVYGAYIVVVKIDQTGDGSIGVGDVYSYKITVVSNNNEYLNFSDTDNWSSIN